MYVSSIFILKQSQRFDKKISVKEDQLVLICNNTACGYIVHKYSYYVSVMLNKLQRFCWSLKIQLHNYDNYKHRMYNY